MPKAHRPRSPPGAGSSQQRACSAQGSDRTGHGRPDRSARVRARPGRQAPRRRLRHSEPAVSPEGRAGCRSASCLRRLLQVHLRSSAARVPCRPKVRSASALPDLLSEPQSPLRDDRLPFEPFLPLSLHLRPLGVPAGHAPRPPENSLCTGDGASENTPLPPRGQVGGARHAHKPRWHADLDEDGYLFSPLSTSIFWVDPRVWEFELKFEFKFVRIWGAAPRGNSIVSV